jgi:uncharacterized protein (UPF0297 family)
MNYEPRNKESLLKTVYKYLKDRGYENVKADLLDTETPRMIVENISGDQFKPDITATHNENSYIFELEMGNSFDNNKENFIKKCNVFQQYASEHNGKLYLIVPIEYFDTIMTEVNKHYLENIGILHFNNN